MDVKQLAKQYLETKIKLKEQRRKIDYDFKRRLEEWKKDTSVEGNLKVIQYRAQIQNEEQYYNELYKEVADLGSDLKPTIEEIKATSQAPLKVHVKDRTYFDVYITDERELHVSEYYTQT